MAQSKKILLVEGEADKSFFKKVCEHLSIDTSVLVAPPKLLGGDFNTKGGVINHLKTLIPQLEDGQITNIAVIVDADYEVHGGGFQNTIQNITDTIKPYGFVLRKNTAKNAGLRFEHTDGLSDFGLWIMPDNKQEGMLEDWIKVCLKDDEKPLFQQASHAVNKIAKPRKFKDHLITKAEVATWLAWQKQPGHGLYSAMKRNAELLNFNNTLFKEIEQWLLKIFK